ncbi:MAG: phosphotriesterase [Marinilabiliales bacterium]|nr:MAG: phosphotriesterase [Marinilabiliales bacterium]
MRTLTLVFLVIIILSGSCREKPVETVIMTVRGPVPAAELGQTLSHEHVLVDWAGAGETGYHRWNRDSVTDVVLPWLQEISELGVTGFADCSPAYLGRDPLLLKELSLRSGIHIITNTGYYGAVNNRFIPPHAYRETAGELASRWIDEFENGIDNTDIRPGFIKIGVKEDTLLSELHRKLVRAAAITHRRTGLVIKSHTGGDMPAFDQLNLLKEEGVSPGAFIWTHAQSGTMPKIVEAARMGAWISLDAVNISAAEGPHGNHDLYISMLSELKKEGLLHRVLISHDAGWYDAGEPGGGGFRGYSDIHRFLIPGLMEEGFTAGDIEQLMVANPARAYEIMKRLAD